MNVTVKNLNINYSDSGGEGKTVLFLHGWGAPITTYPFVLKPLETKYRVVAFDMPGCGLSQEPPEPLTVKDYADFAEEFCRALDITECIIICHSHGGRVAADLMTRQNSVKVTKAVFIDAAGVPPKRSLGYKLRQRAYKCLRVLGTSKLTAPLFREVYEVQREKRSSADYKAATPVMRRTLSNVVSADMRPCLEKISAPVLLVWGEKDTATPLWMGQEMNRLIKDSGLAVIKGGSHFPFVENPAQFSAVMAAYLLN